MCIGNEVVAMLKRGISSCSCSGNSSVIEEDTDKEGLPTLSPKLEMGLSRQLTTRPAFSGSSASVDVGVDSATFPAASERLKPQPFRRKDPAPHFQAAVRGDTQDLDKYLSHGGDPDSRDEQGWALLHHATMHGRKECVRLLLRRGARHDITSIGGHTVLHLASANRHLEVVKRLVEAGARVNSRNAHGNTALHSAAATGTVDVFRYLLSRSADPDAVNSVGETPGEVCGATAEVTDLLDEARRQKKARIAQRFALVKIHKLWNSGRAEPCGERNFTATGEDKDAKLTGEDERPATIEPEAEAGRPPNTQAVLAGAVFTHLQLEADALHVAGEGGGGEDSSRTCLESTVLGIAGLPQEVLRRIVSYCNL